MRFDDVEFVQLMTPVLRRLLTLECMHMCCLAWRCPMFNVASGSFLVWGTPYAPRCLVESACPSRGLQAVNWSELHRPPSGPVDQFDFLTSTARQCSSHKCLLSSAPPTQPKTYHPRHTLSPNPSSLQLHLTSRGSRRQFLRTVPSGIVPSFNNHLVSARRNRHRQTLGYTAAFARPQTAPVAARIRWPTTNHFSTSTPSPTAAAPNDGRTQFLTVIPRHIVEPRT